MSKSRDSIRQTMQSPFVIKRAPILLLLVVVWCIGLFASFKVTISLFGPDADMSHTAVLWSGLHEYGWRFLKEYYYTPDNWLLSIAPIHFLVYWICGVKPEIIQLSGWMVFVGSAVLSGLIARTLEARKTTIFVPPLLLFAGDYAHRHGFASYSMSHNITNFYGLLIVFCVVRWIQSRRISLLWLVLLLSIVAGVSDPWLLASYILPISLTALLAIFTFKGPGDARSYSMLFGTTLLAGLVIKTNGLGAFSFVPAFHFQFADPALIRHNAFYFVECLGGLLLMVPGNGDLAFVPCLISLLILFSLMLGAVLLVARNKPSQRPGVFVLLSVIALSTTGISAAFILSNIPAAEYSGRFLINGMYLAPLLISVALELHWGKASNFFKIATVSAAGLFVLSGVSSNYDRLSKRGTTFNNIGLDDFAKFLDQHGLTYGYGPYWGSQANAITCFSNPRIRIRPVTFSKTTGCMIVDYRPQTYKGWYRSEAAPLGQQEYFVVVVNDGEECQDIRLCVDGLTKQFGLPSRTLEYKGALILVWQHPLIAYFADRFKPITLETQIPFDETAGPIDWPGWSYPEKWGVWSVGNSAFVKLELSSHPAGDLELVIQGHAFVVEQHPMQEMDVLVNEHPLGTLRYSSDADVVKTVRIPAAVVSQSQGRLLIEFQMKNPMSPAQLGLGGDPRLLGLGLVALQVREARELSIADGKFFRVAQNGPGL